METREGFDPFECQRDDRRDGRFHADGGGSFRLRLINPEDRMSDHPVGQAVLRQLPDAQGGFDEILSGWADHADVHSEFV